MFKRYSFIFAAVLIFAASSYATIHFVTPATESITSLVQNIAPGDTIILEEGTYSQKIEIIDNEVTIGSRDLIETLNPPARFSTILDGSNTEMNGNALIMINHSTASIVGLTLVNNNNVIENHPTPGGGISVDSSTVLIDYCLIRNNQASSGGGIYTRRGHTTILNSEISDNSASFCGGIYVSGQFIEISYSKLSGNVTTHLDGGNLGLFSSDGSSITNNIIEEGFGDIWAGGILILHGDNIEIKRNIFRGNHTNDMGGAIKTSRTDNLMIRGNIFCENTAGEYLVTGTYNGIGGAMCFYEGEGIEVSKNTFIGNQSNGAIVLMYTSGMTCYDNMFLNNQGYQYTAFYLWGHQDTPANITIENNAFKYHHHNAQLIHGYHGVIGSRRDSELTLHHNDFIKNEGFAVGYISDHGIILDDFNYWGDITGPFHQALNPGGEGDTMHVDVVLNDFALEEFWDYGMQFSESTYDFGNVEIGNSATEEIEITNITEFAMMINYFDLFYDNVFTIPQLDSLILEGNESYLIPVTFTPEDTIDYFDVLASVSTDFCATGSTIELTGYGIPVTDVQEKDPLPTSFHVSEAHPNPFNGQTRISVFLPEAGNLNIAVYDINGRLVSQVAQGLCDSGTKDYTISLNDQSSGTYFVKIISGKENITKKLMLIR